MQNYYLTLEQNCLMHIYELFERIKILAYNALTNYITDNNKYLVAVKKSSLKILMNAFKEQFKIIMNNKSKIIFKLI